MSHHRFKLFLVERCRDLEELFFPPTCVGCGETVRPFQSDRPIFCPACLARFHTDRLPIEDLLDGDRSCLTHIALVAYHPGRINGVSERLIYTMKHKNYHRVFRAVAEELKPRVQSVWQRLYVDSDEIVWVYPPRRPSAIRKDGFDQAEKLAKHLAKICGGDCWPLLERTRRHTKEQKRLNAKARRINTSQVYDLPVEARPYVQGKMVMLVDDVCTTGSTLGACAELLIQAGAEAVIWVTVAKV